MKEGTMKLSFFIQEETYSFLLWQRTNDIAFEIWRVRIAVRPKISTRNSPGPNNQQPCTSLEKISEGEDDDEIKKSAQLRTVGRLLCFDIYCQRSRIKK